MGDMMDGMGGGMGVWMLLWGLVGLAVLCAAVVGAVWAVRTMIGGRPQQNPEVESPEEILRRRYAAGEIDEDEYFRRRSGLS